MVLSGQIPFCESRYDIPLFTIFTVPEMIDELAMVASGVPGGLETRLGCQYTDLVQSQHSSTHDMYMEDVS
jgi:hypothetical protein